MASTFRSWAERLEISSRNSSLPQFVPTKRVLTMLVPLRTLVYHRMCLTQIEIFRFIRIHFVCIQISVRKLLRATLYRAVVVSIEERS